MPDSTHKSYLMRFMKQATVLFLLLTSTPVWAHAPIAGVDSFMNGVLHPLIIPAQVLLLISLGLLLGRQGTKAIGSIVPFFLFCLLVSVGLSLILSPLPEWVFLVIALGLALWLISSWAIADRLLWVIALVVAFLIGTDSLIEEFNGRERYVALAGSCLGSYVLLLYTAGIGVALNRFKNGIVLRILGSWITASILLVLSLGLIGKELTT